MSETGVEMPKKRTRLTARGKKVVAAIAAAGALGGTAVVAARDPRPAIMGEYQREQTYKLGQIISPPIEGVELVNNFDSEGNLVGPYGVVDLAGEAGEVEIPKGLADKFTAQIVVGPSYILPADLTTEQYEALAEAWNLPPNIGQFNDFPTGRPNEHGGLYITLPGALVDGQAVAVPLNFAQHLAPSQPSA